MDVDHVVALIRARCPELDPDEIEARLAQRPVVMLDDQTAAKLIDALDQLETRVGQTIANAQAYREAAEAAAAFIDSASVDTVWN